MTRTASAAGKAGLGEVATFNREVREGPAEKVTFGQKANGGEGVCQQTLWGRAFRQWEQQRQRRGSAQGAARRPIGWRGMNGSEGSGGGWIGV